MCCARQDFFFFLKNYLSPNEPPPQFYLWIYYTTPIALSTSTTNERSYVESLVIEEEAKHTKNQFNMEVFFFNKEKSGKIFHFRVFFFLYVFILIFYWKLFVSVKKSTFRSKLSSFSLSLLFLTVVLFELSWRHLSLYTHEKKQKKTLWCCLFCLFFYYYSFAFMAPQFIRCPASFFFLFSEEICFQKWRHQQ
jgi:hypothetical protein